MIKDTFAKPELELLKSVSGPFRVSSPHYNDIMVGVLSAMYRELSTDDNRADDLKKTIISTIYKLQRGLTPAFQDETNAPVRNY